MQQPNIKTILLRHGFAPVVYVDKKKPVCHSSNTQDMSTQRAHTLYDDADDIQRQLENEARDRVKFGKTKTIWVFHLPTISKDMNRPRRDVSSSFKQDVMSRAVTDANMEDILSEGSNKPWDYKDQRKWGSQYPECAGRSQSPVDLPYKGFLKVTGARRMLFINHDEVPESLSVINDGKSVKLSGVWNSKRPIIYGGAAHSRRYVFDSILLHWPSEHTINGLQYPIESQAIYVSAEHASVDEALNVTNDKLALLGVANLYKFSNRTHKGLRELLEATLKTSFGSNPINHHPVSFFNPPLKEYVCYHGSLTSPPCTESVLWLVRARSLPVTREHVEAVQNIFIGGESQHFFRQTQPLNDRKVYFFN